jgi:LCP family protein required for cell wall assembly
MILVSINKKSKQIVMTSIMRDSYVSIPGYGNTRINAAYAYGGEDLLIDTIEQNFKIQIDRYVAVNFFTFVDVVDAVGGVDITVTDAEAEQINAGSTTAKLPGAGTYHLNGSQALAYSRIRHVGNADYQRTERQRTVLEEIFNNMKGASLTELNDMLNVILPELRTDIKEGELFSLMLGYVSSYKDYEVVQCRVPYDGTITNLVINGAMVLGIDMEANQEYLRENIYGE